MRSNPNRLMLAGVGSGCGKTTVTCAVLGALKARGLAVAAFKAGPDYIDPMFHTEVVGTNSRNLDLFLMGENGVRCSLADHAAGQDIAVIEGVMGFYDGMGKTAEYSSCDLSNRTKTPVVLTVSCKGMSLTLCALLKGLREFRENRICGVILNQVSSAKTYEMYREMIEANTGMQVYGYLPKMPEVSLESRHLGLVTAAEVGQLKKMIALLAAQAEETIDIDGLLTLSKQAEAFSYTPFDLPALGRVRIGIARDKAFCFYYEDSLKLLRGLGAELVPFSPLEDGGLPEEIDGLLFGGGYPELSLSQLSKNHDMLRNIRQAWKDRMPMIGECGGFIYLQEQFRDADGTVYPLAGCIASETQMTGRLQRFGYVSLTAEQDNLLCEAGESICGHEFHYADSSNCGTSFTATKVSSGMEYHCIVADDRMFAGYPHLHYYGNPAFAERLIKACLAYQRERVQESGRNRKA